MHEIKDKILNARNILVILPENPKPSLLTAVLSLALALEDSGKRVGFIHSGNHNIFSIVKKPKDISEEIKESGDLVISINVKNKNLKELKYEKLDDYLHIYVDAGKEGLKKDAISAKFSKSPYDLILAFGVKEKEHLGNFYVKNQDIFKGANIEYINSESYFKTIFNFLTSIKTKHTKDTATGLLASAVMETANFQKTNEPNIFKAASFLMEAGANHQAVVKQLREDIEAEELKNIGLILKNSSYLANSILIKINAPEMKEHDLNIKKITQLLPRVKNIIPEKDNFITLAEIIPQKDKKPVIIGVFSSSKKETMEKFAGIFDSSTTNDNIIFSINSDSLEDAEKKIITLLNHSF